MSVTRASSASAKASSEEVRISWQPATSAKTSSPKPKISLGLIVPVLWYALETSRGVSQWLAMMGYELPITDIVEGSPIDRAVYSALIVLGLIILMTRTISWKEIAGNNKWLIALFCYMLVSICWSDFGEVSLKRWVRALGDGVMALVVLAEAVPLEGVSTVLRSVIFIHFPLSVIFVKYLRQFGTAYDYEGVEMWTGIATHKNVLGQVVMIGSIYLIFEMMRNWRNWKVWVYSSYFLMGSWLLLAPPMNRSNTSIAILFLGALVLIAIGLLKEKPEIVNRYVVLFLVGFGVMFLVGGIWEEVTGVSIIASAVQASGRDITLSGRTDLWSDLLAIASSNPILGLGYGSFWIGNTHNLWDTHIWGPTQGHNGYIDVYLELGAIGLFVLAGVVISAYKTIIKSLVVDFEMARLRFIWLIIILIHNFTESSFLRGTVDMWFIFLLATINMPLRGDAGAAVKQRLSSGK